MIESTMIISNDDAGNVIAAVSIDNDHFKRGYHAMIVGVPAIYSYEWQVIEAFMSKHGHAIVSPKSVSGWVKIAGHTVKS